VESAKHARQVSGLYTPGSTIL